AWIPPIVRQDECLRRELLAEPIRERRAPALHLVGRQGAADEADEARRDALRQNHGAATRFGLRRAEHRRRLVSSLGADRLGFELAGRAPDSEAETGLHLTVLARNRLQEGVGARNPIAAGDASRGDYGRFTVLVDVDDLLDRADPVVAIECNPLDPHGEV